MQTNVTLSLGVNLENKNIPTLVLNAIKAVRDNNITDTDDPNFALAVAWILLEGSQIGELTSMTLKINGLDNEPED